MPDAPDGRGQNLLQPVATVKQNTDTLLNQLKKADIDDDLLSILEGFFIEKATSEEPEDRQYLMHLASEIKNILKKYRGINLKIILMQRLIMYGLNSPQLISYYYDAFIRLTEDIDPDSKRKFVARLIKKTEVSEIYRWYPEYPTLKESLQKQLYAWIKNIEREKYGFFTIRGNGLGPLYKLGVKPAVFMYVYRSMEEVGFLERLALREPLYKYMSQVIVSDQGEKLEPKTFKNRFVYDDIKHLDTAIAYVQKMKERLEFAKEIEMRR